MRKKSEKESKICQKREKKRGKREKKREKERQLSESTNKSVLEALGGSHGAQKYQIRASRAPLGRSGGGFGSILG